MQLWPDAYMATNRTTSPFAGTLAAEALPARMCSQHEVLLLACGAANRSEDALSIEREFDAVPGGIVEP